MSGQTENLIVESLSEGGRTRVSLTGAINEEFSPEILGNLTGPVSFNLERLQAINSLGIRKWINYIKSIAHLPVVYEACSHVFARQLLIVPSLKGHAKVQSLMLDYYCDDCEKQLATLLSQTAYATGGIPAQPCPKCGAAMSPELSKTKIDSIFK